MKKSYILFASAALLFAGCANDEFTGDKGLSSDNAPIAFNMQTGAQTRATSEGATAADKLSKEFIVWGEKNETSTSGAAAGENDLVFKNYRVQYTQNSANTTLSNTKDWEYVGIKPYKSDYVSPSIYVDDNTTQTIKYWDMKAGSYTFTAVSALKGDIETNQYVKIEKIVGGETTTSATDKGYTITVKSGASTGNIYVADRVVVSTKQEGTINRTEPNKYGGLVQFTFRNFETKIRFGIYETVPGYKVSVDNVKYNASAAEASTSKFGVAGDFVTTGDDTKYTVTYDTNNKAVLALNGTPAKTTYLESGDKIMKAEALGTSSTAATYEDYTNILPNPSNETNMTFTISYTLTSEDTGEKIKVEDKKVEVPAAYCKWKSNYAYTYLFKITDSSAELYPITFDAVVETDENGNQETITTVTEPSITTFGYDESGKKIITGTNEYPAGTAIYASVVANGTVASDLSTNAALYTVTTESETDFPITEASVANAIAQAEKTPAVTGKVKANKVTDGVTYPTDVPAEDGGTRSLNAMKWTGTVTSGSETYYAVEYTKDDKKTYKIVKVVVSTSTPTPMPGE